MRRLTILVVDDEANIVKFVASNLRAAGYHVLTAVDGDEALRVADAAPIGLVLLDLMLPRIDGFEVCRRLRATSDVPILVLSARGEECDKVDALNLGADDYLTKPFGVDELLARVRAVLRRARREAIGSGSQPLARGPFTLDPRTREVTVDGHKATLTPTEFAVLHHLMRHAGNVVPHNQLLRGVWGPEYRNQTEYLRVYVGRLRQKIEPDPTNPRYLLSEPGLGYVFAPEAASA